MFNKDHWIGIIILLGIISIALFGGVKNANNTFISSPNTVSGQNETSLGQTTTENKNSFSQYQGLVTLGYINKSTDPGNEYLTIRVGSNLKTPVLVTGWTLQSRSSGASVTIPKGIYLFFTRIPNAEENIYLEAGDTLYLVTGISPNGASFKINKCSGYLGQFQTFIPYINNNCPMPKDENLSEIPGSVNNDACFDYIDSFPRCRIQTESLPINWSYECTKFIYDKINYPSCVDVHKNDKDFYEHQWRVYLKRSDHLWKDKRENIVLLDNSGKVVDTLKY